MSFNNLPAAIQSVIQTGFLERTFGDSLRAKLGFRAVADREMFGAGIGESITKTRTGLLPAVTDPMAAASNTDITSGLTPQNYSVEQYILSVNQYAANMMLNVATSRVAIADLYLQNAAKLAEQASRSIDTLAQKALFNAYMGGNTRVKTTLGAPATTVAVDDIRGFQKTLNSSGQPVDVSVSNTVTVTVNGTGYTLTGATADGSNVSTAPGGISGTLTFSGNVSVANATAGNSVISGVAPSILRPSTSSGLVMADNTSLISAANDINAGRLTLDMILAGKAQLEANSVPKLEDGYYNCYADPIHLTGLYKDSSFLSFFRGKNDSEEYRRGVIADTLGVRIIETNQNPVQALAGVGTVRRAVVCGAGALVEGVFTRTAYEAANAVDDSNMTTFVDDVAMVTREPLDALKQVVTQSWSYIGGFVAPTDTTANSTVLPTASNAAYKRAVVLESL
jgi:hypothetical protein